MIKLEVYSRDTRINDMDYIYEKVDKLTAVLPYLTPKFDGDWQVAIVEPPLQFVRDIMVESVLPSHITLWVYLDRMVIAQLQLEQPQLAYHDKTKYEKFLDLIAGSSVGIHPDAAKELYKRMGASKERAEEYMSVLELNSNNREITVGLVKKYIPDDRRIYASQVLMEFLLHDRSRWTHFNKLMMELGDSYTFYAMRKASLKLLEDKEKYLRNEDVKNFRIGDIEGFRINQAYTLFYTARSFKQLLAILYTLDNRQFMEELL